MRISELAKFQNLYAGAKVNIHHLLLPVSLLRVYSTKCKFESPFIQ